MPLFFVRNDAEKIKCDALVNAESDSLRGESRAGQSKASKGFLRSHGISIHTVCPVWEGGVSGEKELLFDCYTSSLQLAVENKCDSVAFPLLSSGTCGFPQKEALNVAIQAISEFLETHELTVYLTLFYCEVTDIGETLYRELDSYIHSHFFEAIPYSVSAHAPSAFPTSLGEASSSRRARSPKKRISDEAVSCSPDFTPPAASIKFTPQDIVLQVDESFSEMLLRKIDECGMTDAQCYRKANIDRRLFSKIRADVHYKPSKNTAIAFAVALELSLAEAGELLLKAGYALSHSNRFDLIVEYFIVHGNYNIFEINEVLFAFDQELLGA